MQMHPSAICVQRFDDSFNPAIHITYRISLRSSSSPEPRDPPLRGMDIGFESTASSQHQRLSVIRLGVKVGNSRRRTEKVSVFESDAETS